MTLSVVKRTNSSVKFWTSLEAIATIISQQIMTSELMIDATSFYAMIGKDRIMFQFT